MENLGLARTTGRFVLRYRKIISICLVECSFAVGDDLGSYMYILVKLFETGDSAEWVRHLYEIIENHWVECFCPR